MWEIDEVVNNQHGKETRYSAHRREAERIDDGRKICAGQRNATKSSEMPSRPSIVGSGYDKGVSGIYSKGTWDCLAATIGRMDENNLFDKRRVSYRRCDGLQTLRQKRTDAGEFVGRETVRDRGITRIVTWYAAIGKGRERVTAVDRVQLRMNRVSADANAEKQNDVSVRREGGGMGWGPHRETDAERIDGGREARCRPASIDRREKNVASKVDVTTCRVSFGGDDRRIRDGPNEGGDYVRRFRRAFTGATIACGRRSVRPSSGP